MFHSYLDPLYFSFSTITRLKSKDISKFFLCLDISYLTLTYEKTHLEVLKNVEFFRIFFNLYDYFRHFRGFRINFFCTVNYSYVLSIIRFLVKFCVVLSMWDHGGQRGNIVLYQKRTENVLRTCLCFMFSIIISITVYSIIISIIII